MKWTDGRPMTPSRPLILSVLSGRGRLQHCRSSFRHGLRAGRRAKKTGEEENLLQLLKQPEFGGRTAKGVQKGKAINVV
eukprot:3579158-Pleurochrysis_carterae.AAC.2